MSSHSNPFVEHLNRYTTAASDHEATFDEFIAEIPPPSAGSLRLNTHVEAYLRGLFAQPNPPSIILTGNAGDGKTYLCRQIVQTFTRSTTIDWEQISATPVLRGDQKLWVVKDLSEIGEKVGRKRLQDLQAQLDNLNERFLIAANEGRLRALLATPELANLRQIVEAQLDPNAQANHPDLLIINLTEVSTATFVPEALGWMSDPQHWTDCATCPIAKACPIQWNAQQLGRATIRQNIQRLYETLEQLGEHITIRDMLIHLAYTVTANQRCDQMQQRVEQRASVASYAYHQTIWGHPSDPAFQRKARVLQHLSRLEIGSHSVYAIDDMIVSGGHSPAEKETHEQIFADAVDLDQHNFSRDRDKYLSGSNGQLDRAEELLKWLPIARRKLFFEWDDPQISKLLPFQHIDTYRKLVAGEPNVLLRSQRDLVLGLNRAFSHLFLSYDDNLYVTIQYSHNNEQPQPLVRVKINRDAIQIVRGEREHPIYGPITPSLWLLIGPPANQRSEPVRWKLGLLTFEYLMRIARGGTYDILAAECELSVRGLKDQLLSRFGQHGNPSQIDFFVAARHTYKLASLWIDTNGKIQGSQP